MLRMPFNDNWKFTRNMSMFFSMGELVDVTLPLWIQPVLCAGRSIFEARAKK